MGKTSLYEMSWILSLIGGIVCIFFALLSFLDYVSEILEKPIKGLTGMVSGWILGIMGFFILGASRMTKNGGQRATTGGIFLLIFGCVAYCVGSAIGATLALLSGLLVVLIRHI